MNIIGAISWVLSILGALLLILDAPAILLVFVVVFGAAAYLQRPRKH